jgi:hypothetical protein
MVEIRFRDGTRKTASNFELWLRTGRLVIAPDTDPTEAKFNPWHDPSNGQFTYAGGGAYAASSPARIIRALRRLAEARRRRESNNSPRKPEERAPRTEATPAAAAAATVKPKPLRSVLANGYRFLIDWLNRTEFVSGWLRIGGFERRSRRSQRQAGLPDRRATDDGGHYIARRFNGPSDAFNHFAQDANFNRGGYRALEDKWAGALKSGSKVFVTIDPRFRGSSQRPYEIVVRYKIDQNWFSQTFRNRPRSRKSDG